MQPVPGKPAAGGTTKLGSQARFGRIRSWVLKENPRGTVPNTGTATGVATTATGRAPLGPGAAPGKPGEARQGATANGREDGTGRRGIRADVIVTPLPAARSRPEVLRAAFGKTQVRQSLGHQRIDVAELGAGDDGDDFSFCLRSQTS